MSQEYDIQEYWEQFDDKTRWVGFSTINEEKKETSTDEFYETVMWVVNQPEIKENDSDKRIQETFKNNSFVQYGMKRKRDEDKNDEVVRQELLDTFEKMKQTVK